VLFAVVALAVLASIVSGALIVGAGPLRRDPVDVLTEHAFVEPFIGLPPEGATPSTPEAANLVVAFGGRVGMMGGDFHRMWLYDDGRLIWKSNLEGGDVGFGAWTDRFGGTEPTTAVIEQRLSQVGVDLMRAEVLASARVIGVTTLDEDGTQWSRPGVIWGGLTLGDGDRLLDATWSDSLLPLRLAHPAAWLPADAWADRRVGGYVPGRYAVCVEPSGADGLTEPTTELLRSKATLVADPRCPYRLTTEDARAVVATLDAAADQPDRIDHLRYPLVGDAFVEVLPVVPHGEVVCNCG
jgi:hypothetical protein